MPFILSSQSVFDYLITQELCGIQEHSASEITLKPGKNFNLLIRLPDDRQFLVKQERHDREGKTRGEFVHEWRIHEFLRKFPELSQIHSYFSEAIHFDAENSIIVFKYLNEYRDLADFYIQDNYFPTEVARILGATLGSIHRLTLNREDYQEFWIADETKPYLAGGLERITPEIFGMVSTDGLKFFALYQRYDQLGKAIAYLSQALVPCCLTHNDLKLNNILISLNWEAGDSQEVIRLIDWESCAWGDPANDLGTLIASYLQIWLYSMVTSKAIAIEDSLRLATIPLQILQPSIAALTSAYLAHFPEVLEFRPDFLQLVVQFCGLALIRSIQATLQHERTFDNSGICMLQVAKSLLCRPSASIPTIFGMEASKMIPMSLSR